MDICEAALKEGKPIRCQPGWQESVDWLVEHDLAARTASGQMVLLSKSLRSVTKLAAPEPLREPPNSGNSLWGLRRKMEREGWCSLGKKATATEKSFNQNNTSKTYYCLLLECCVAHFA